MTGYRRVCGTILYILLHWIKLRTRLNQYEMLVTSLIHEITLKTLLVQKKPMLRENNTNRESNIRSSKFSHTYVMNDINLLAVVTPPSIYHILN